MPIELLEPYHVLASNMPGGPLEGGGSAEAPDEAEEEDDESEPT